MLYLNNKNLCSSCFNELDENLEICPLCGYSENGTVKFPIALPMGTILLGKYVIGKVLGKGGFGITYLAYDVKNENRVAIKEYMPDSLAYRNPGTTLISTYLGEKEENFKVGAEKFYDEAKTIARFNGHPNIINVYEFFYENNTAYFVMEYIDGIDLKTYIEQNGGKISVQKTLDIITPLIDALIVIHSVGVLHRDISPDNIYITKDNDVKLLDFGAARQVLGEQSKSLSIVLKPGFAPIEQYQTHGKQGPWTDIYALAATMYYCITGYIPESAMDRVVEDNIKPLSVQGFKVNSQFDEVMAKAFAVLAVNRYQSIMEFKSDILKLNAVKFRNDYITEKNTEPNEQKRDVNKAGKKGFTFNLSYFKNKYTVTLAAACCFIIIASIAIYGILSTSSSNPTNIFGGGNYTSTYTSDYNSTDYSSDNLSGVITNSNGTSKNTSNTKASSNTFTSNTQTSNVQTSSLIFNSSSNSRRSSVQSNKSVTSFTSSSSSKSSSGDPIQFYGNTAGNIINLGLTAVQGEWIYYQNASDNCSLYKIKTNDTGKMKLNNEVSYYINVVGDWIYYQNTSDNGKLYRIKTDGSGKTKLNDDISYSVNVAGEWIYYQNKSDSDRLYKIKTDGSGKTKLNNDVTYSINVSGDYIYYSNGSDNSRLYKIKTNGSERAKIDDIFDSVNVVGDWIYY